MRLRRAVCPRELCCGFYRNAAYPVVDETGHSLRGVLVEADLSRETHGKSHTTLMYLKRELSWPLRLKFRECSAAMAGVEPVEQAWIPRLTMNKE